MCRKSRNREVCDVILSLHARGASSDEPETIPHELRRQRKGRNYMYYVYSDITYGRLRFIGGKLGSYMHVYDPKMKVLCGVSVISEHVCVNSAGSLV